MLKGTPRNICTALVKLAGQCRQRRKLEGSDMAAKPSAARLQGSVVTISRRDPSFADIVNQVPDLVNSLAILIRP